MAFFFMKKIFTFIFLVFSIPLFSQDILINEFCAKNNNVISDNDFNQFTDWIELHNNTSTNITLSGSFLTDDTLQKTKWQFPSGSFIAANSFLLIWADKEDTLINSHHTNFKLSSGNEWVALYDPDTNLIDLIEYPNQFTNISYGKASSGLAYFSAPTPLSANNTTAYYSNERENQPSFSLTSGFYIADTELVITGISATSMVYYTTDGSYPDENSNIYTEPIVLTENTVVRAKTYGGLLPGKEKSCSYFIDNTKQLPVVSLIIDPDFLWSDSIGIFNDFEIEKRILWERSSKIQYFKSNDLKFETNNDIRLFGTTAFELPQKSFAVFANNTIQYQIFEDKEVDSFESFIMRSSSDDWNKTMFKDGFVQTIVQQKLEIDYQAYKPTVLYINGEYFGIFNMREKYNEDYLVNNHGIDKDSIDMLKLGYWSLSVEVLAGTNEKYYELLDYLNINDMSDDDVFAGVAQYLDIDDYTNYIITQIYTGNRSYKHNIKAWRENSIIDGFKWLLYDMDRAYMDSWRQIFLMIYDADPVLVKLLENINYRNHFLQQSCSHINVTFRKSYIDNLIDSLQNNIESEMPSHIEKWGPEGGIQSISDWNIYIQIMKDFAMERKDSLLHRLDSTFSLSGQVSVLLKKSVPHGGDVYIEDVLIPYNDSIHTYFKGIPVKLVAKPRPGHKFIDWENISDNDTIYHIFDSDETIHARFEVDCDIPQIITEDAILLKECSPYYFENDVTVETGVVLYCEPGVEVFFGGNVKLKVYGSIDFAGTENEPIIIQGNEGIYWKYIKSENGDIHLKHTIIYSGKKAISFSAGGNILIENCIFHESNLDMGDLISGNSANVIFTGNQFYGNQGNNKKDCIDCDGIPSGIFTGNIFYDITDDCIDIGDNSSDIIIERNSFYNCESMGISIGENTVADIRRNIFANCQGAIQVHSGAMATITNNTLYENETGIKCFHYENTPNSGGTANVVNTIFSQCINDYALQPNSEIDISYSLSDLTLHSGTGNLFGSPNFLNAMADNFQLSENSPCIDAGDTLSPPDPDGSRVDIGALYFDKNNFIPEFINSIAVYPNPFASVFTVQLYTGSIISRIDIYNLLGQNMYSKNDVNEERYIVETKVKGLLLIRVSDKKG
ncbi:MAG: hypothetical protein DRJ05_00800, partial [Bacteroidetes bacterium]